VRAAAPWRARTPAVGSEAAAASDTAVGDAQGEEASAAREARRRSAVRAAQLEPHGWKP
jgi:hypothetical protein